MRRSGFRWSSVLLRTALLLYCIEGWGSEPKGTTNRPLNGPNDPGASMIILVNSQVHLSEFRPSDKPALVEHLNDRDIYDRTLRIPYPYTENDADEWLA